MKCDCAARDAMFKLVLFDNQDVVMDKIECCGDCILELMFDAFSTHTIARLKENK
jgi:hypothetical protein